MSLLLGSESAKVGWREEEAEQSLCLADDFWGVESRSGAENTQNEPGSSYNTMKQGSA